MRGSAASRPDCRITASEAVRETREVLQQDIDGTHTVEQQDELSQRMVLKDSGKR